MILEKVGGMVEVGNEDENGEMNGGKEVEVSIRVVPMVEDKTSVVGICEVSTELVTCALEFVTLHPC